MKKPSKTIKFLIILGAIGLIWTALTFIAEKEGKGTIDTIGNPSAIQSALIVYDPDPFYNFDQQICTSFAKGLASQGWLSKITTVAATADLETENFDLYVFCTNTYNWNPDRILSDYIKEHKFLKGKKVIAITLGSGSTQRSQRILERIIHKKEANIIGSESYWLIRPNDASNSNESNINSALDHAYTFGKEIALSIDTDSTVNIISRN